MRDIKELFRDFTHYHPLCGYGRDELEEKIAAAIDAQQARIEELELTAQDTFDLYQDMGRVHVEESEKYEARIAELEAVKVPNGMVLVPIDDIRRAHDSIASFCGDEGWGTHDMINMDDLYYWINKYDKAMLSAAPEYEAKP